MPCHYPHLLPGIPQSSPMGLERWDPVNIMPADLQCFLMHLRKFQPWAISCPQGVFLPKLRFAPASRGSSCYLSTVPLPQLGIFCSLCPECSSPDLLTAGQSDLCFTVTSSGRSLSLTTPAQVAPVPSLPNSLLIAITASLLTVFIVCVTVWNSLLDSFMM